MAEMNVGACLFFVVYFFVYFLLEKTLSVCTFGYTKKGLDMQNTKNDLHRMCFAVNFAKFFRVECCYLSFFTNALNVLQYKNMLRMFRIYPLNSNSP